MIVVYDEAGNILYSRKGEAIPPRLRPGLRVLKVNDGTRVRIQNQKVDVKAQRLVPMDQSAIMQRERSVNVGWSKLRGELDS